MAASTVVENEKPNKPPRKVNHIKMQIVPDLQSDTAKEIVEKDVAFNSEIQSDDSFNNIQNIEGGCCNAHCASCSNGESKKNVALGTYLYWQRQAITFGKWL